MTDAAVEKVERDGTGQQLVRKRNKKCWWDPHLYAGRCNNLYNL